MTDDLDRSLLTLLTARTPLPASFCAAWTPADWDHVEATLRQHRLAPWLHWQLTRAQRGVEAPADRAEKLREAFRDASLRSLALQGELLKVHRLLDAAGIEHIALKGAFLAPHAYPHPALRTMRDLDVLVRPGEAMRAFDVLLAGGCARVPRYPGDPQAFLDGGKHLPPLRGPSGRILLEVHARLVSPGEAGHVAADAVDEAGIWERRISVPGSPPRLWFMAPTDLLLHLIVHAAYDHRFDNGPLILADVAFIIERHPIDWPLFWTLAERGGWTRGARLLLCMASSAFGFSLPEAGWPAVGGAADFDELVDTASLLTLRDVDSRVDQEFLGAMDDAQGWRAKLRLAFAKALPSRQRIAAQFPVDARSPAVILWYPARWWYLLERAVELRRNRRLREAARRVEQRLRRQRVESLDRWLRSDPRA